MCMPKNLTESINERVDLCVSRLVTGGRAAHLWYIWRLVVVVVATKIGGDTHAGVDFKPISKPDKCAA